MLGAVLARLGCVGRAQRHPDPEGRQQHSRQGTQCTGASQKLCSSVLRHGVRIPAPRRPKQAANRVLRGIGYHGASAEIGVWQGAMSLAIMRANPSMGRHLSVDPWIGHMGGCDKLADRHCAMIRGKNGALVRKANNTKFDGMHRNVVTSLFSYFPKRSLVVRNFSVEASRLIPDSSLDFIYIDGRHDLAGVSEDLASWWPKLCRGGLLGGHDWIGNGQAAQALRKWMKSQPFGTTGQPPRVYITAENPASYFTFREPCLVTKSMSQ